MTIYEVYECEDESKIVFNRLIGTWRWGTSWEKCVKEGEDYFYIVYRSASGDACLDLEDTLNYEQDKQAQKVALIESSMLKAVPLVS